MYNTDKSITKDELTDAIIQSLEEVGIEVEQGKPGTVGEQLITLDDGRTVKMKDLKFSDLFPMIPEPKPPKRMNPAEIEVIKVKDWQVKFRYRGKTFLLHDESADGDSIVALYEFKAGEFGKYTLEHIKSAYGTMYRNHFDTRRRISEPYSRMDMGYFEWFLNRIGFSVKLEEYCDKATEV